MAETSTIFGFMKYVSATDILSDFKKTVDSHFVNSLLCISFLVQYRIYLDSMIIYKMKKWSITDEWEKRNQNI